MWGIGTRQDELPTFETPQQQIVLDFVKPCELKQATDFCKVESRLHCNLYKVIGKIKKQNVPEKKLTEDVLHFPLPVAISEKLGVSAGLS